MSEKGKPTIGKAYGEAMKDTPGLASARPLEHGRQQYSYRGKNYSESHTWGWGLNKVQDSVYAKDAEITREKITNSRGIVQREESASVILPTESGKAGYHTDTHINPWNARSSESTIVRTDKDGNEVYRFTSNTDAMADKIGAVAAKRIIDSVQEGRSDKAA